MSGKKNPKLKLSRIFSKEHFEHHVEEKDRKDYSTCGGTITCSISLVNDYGCHCDNSEIEVSYTCDKCKFACSKKLETNIAFIENIVNAHIENMK